MCDMLIHKFVLETYQFQLKSSSTEWSLENNIIHREGVCALSKDLDTLERIGPTKIQNLGKVQLWDKIWRIVDDSV